MQSSARCACWLILCLALGPGIRSQASDTGNRAALVQPTLTDVRTVKSLAPQEAHEEIPVRLRGVVSYYDAAWKLLFIQDGTGGIRVEPGKETPEIQAGQSIDLEGVTARRDGRPVIRLISLRGMHRETVPAVQVISLPDLVRGTAVGNCVEVIGIVRSVQERSGRIAYTVVADGERSVCLILSLPQWNNTELVGAKIRVRGVSCGNLDAKSGLKDVRLLVANLGEIVIIEEPEAAFSMPLESPAQLWSKLTPAQSNRRIRFRGVVTVSHPGQALTVQAGPTQVKVETTQTSAVRPGVLVDVVGFPVPMEDEPAVEDALFRRLGLGPDDQEFNLAGEAFEEDDQPSTLPLLTTAAEVRNLTASEAKRGYPVRLRGAVTYYDPGWGMLFLQGATEGIYVDPEDQVMDINSGDLVIMHGESGPGAFAPQIQKPRFQIQGKAALPIPTKRRFEELILGKEDSQWIETEGVVRSVTNDSGHASLQVEADGGGKFNVIVPGFDHRPLPSDLVDSRVQLRGVCGTVFNPNRQILGIQLYVPDLGCILPLDDGAGQLAGRSLVPVRSLLQFKPRERAAHRVRVRGIVTLQLTGGVVYLQDGPDGFWLQSKDAPALVPGDHVEALGFPSPGRFTPAMQDAIVQKIGHGPVPSPIRIAASEALRGTPENTQFDAKLVRIDARLVDYVRNSSDNVLVLEDGQIIFNCPLERRWGEPPLHTLRRGSLLRLTGVCAIQADESHLPRTLRLLLRSKEDIELLKAPAWWMQERLRQILVAMGIVILIASMWVMTLRGQVKRQTLTVRAQLEQEVALEKRFRDLVEHANEMIFSLDLDGAFLSINPAGERLLGLSSPHLTGLPFERLVAPARLASYHEQQRAMLAGKIQHLDELELIHRDGRSVLVEISSWLLRENERPVGVQGIARDITQRRRAEEQLAALSALSHRLSTAKTARDAGLIIVETADRLCGWDACAIDLYFREQDRVETVLSFDRLDGNRLERERSSGPVAPSALAREVIDTGSPVVRGDVSESSRERNPSLPLASLACVPIRNRSEVIGVLSIQSRVPNAYNTDSVHTLQALADHCGGALDRVRAEQALHESESRFRQLAENIEKVFWMIDVRTGQMLYVSPAFERTWGRTCASLYAQPTSWIDAIVPEDRARVSPAHVLPDLSQDRDNVYRIARPDGEIRLIRDRAFPVRDDQGQVYRIAGIAEDITAQRTLEEQYRQAQKMEAVGQLAGGVAHDFNNILTAILFNLDLMKDAPSLDPVLREHVTDLENQANRAANLTRQLLLFSRRSIIQIRTLDLNEVVEDFLKMLRRLIGEHIHLQFHARGGLPLVEADSGMLEQVIMNLAVNARDAMPEGGSLTIATDVVEMDAQQAALDAGARPGQFVRLSVSDTGSGMDGAVLKRLFEPFFTTKGPGKGTGLGLATVYGIVNQHAGWIRVESNLGHGSTFHVFLPAALQSRTKIAPARPAKRPRGGKETILLVEDDPAVRKISEGFLRHLGYQVVEAASGAQALERWKGCQGKVDLLFSDMVMPEGKSGLDLAQELRILRPDLPVIISSGYSADLINRDQLEGHGIVYLPKPSPPADIAAAIRQCLEQSPKTGELAGLTEASANPVNHATS